MGDSILKELLFFELSLKFGVRNLWKYFRNIIIFHMIELFIAIRVGLRLDFDILIPLSRWKVLHNPIPLVQVILRKMALRVLGDLKVLVLGQIHLRLYLNKTEQLV